RGAIWGRVVFWVDDVDAMYRRAVAAGFDPESAPADAPWGERYFHIRDRDGHELSFARPLAPAYCINLEKMMRAHRLGRRLAPPLAARRCVADNPTSRGR